MLCHFLVGVLLLAPTAAPVDDKVDAKLLVGKWQAETLPEGINKFTVEFTKDNKVTLDIDGENGKQKIEGTYKVDGSELHVKFEVNGNEQSQKRKIVKLTEKELVTKDEEMNQERKYKKVK